VHGIKERSIVEVRLVDLRTTWLDAVVIERDGCHRVGVHEEMLLEVGCEKSAIV
jgi:hypothetical protein